MEAIEYRVFYKSRSNTFKLYPLGDIHAGIKHCREKAIKAKVKEIQEDPLAFWIGMGDYGEFITPADPRWDIGVVADWVEKTNVAESQRKWIVKLFEPIKDKCVGLLCGNHEDSIRLHNCQDVQLDICRDLGVKNLGASCFVRFVFSRNKDMKHDSTMFIGYFKHGSGGPQTDGGKMMALKRGLMGFDADIYAMAHLHDIKVDSQPRLHLSENLKIRQKIKVAAITGSWFLTYMQGEQASYGEKRGFMPTPIGCPIFLIHPNSLDPHVSVISGL